MRQAQSDAARGLAMAQMQGWESAIQTVAQQNPDAAALMLKLRTADEGARVDRDYKIAQTEKERGLADKSRSDVRQDQIKTIGRLAYSVASSSGDVSPIQYEMLIRQARHMGTPDEVMNSAPSLDNPDQVKQWAGGLAALSQDPNISSQIWARSIEAPAHVAQMDAAARKSGVEADQIPLTFAESQRSNRAREGVAYGNLALAREKDAREKGGGNDWVNDFANNRQVNKATAAIRPLTENGMPVAKADKPLTEVQGNAMAFGMRAKTANDLFGELEDGGANLGGPRNKLAESSLTNWAASDTAQSARQAKLNFMTATLRKESGAAISQSEYDTEDKKYFPQMGDSKATIAQKRNARALAIETLAAQAGARGAEKIAGSTMRPGEAAAKRVSVGATFERPPEAASVPVGTEGEIDGVRYRSDGKSWVRVQ